MIGPLLTLLQGALTFVSMCISLKQQLAIGNNWMEIFTSARTKWKTTKKDLAGSLKWAPRQDLLCFLEGLDNGTCVV